MIDRSCMESIGKEIKEMIKRKGISRYRVSKDLGVAQESLLRSLKEDANPRWKTVKKVLDYLGYEIRLVEEERKKQVTICMRKPFREVDELQKDRDQYRPLPRSALKQLKRILPNRIDLFQQCP